MPPPFEQVEHDKLDKYILEHLAGLLDPSEKPPAEGPKPAVQTRSSLGTGEPFALELKPRNSDLLAFGFAELQFVPRTTVQFIVLRYA